MEQLPKIVQQRLQATAKAGVHPDLDLLTAFAEKSLNERERGPVLQHLAQCADCRNVISLAMPQVELTPSTPAKLRSPWLTWPALRWGALAACVVVVSAAVTLHYERRPNAEPALAKTIPASVPPANVARESQASSQTGEKLAAKIMPPLSEADRDRLPAGKLAKQSDSDKENTTSAVLTSPSNGVPLGEPAKNSLANERMTDAITMSANKPSQPIRQMAAAAPAPAAPPGTKVINGAPESGGRTDNAEYVARSMNQTVTVQSEPLPAPSTAEAVEPKAKDETPKRESAASAAVVAGTLPADQKADVSSAETVSGAYDGQPRSKKLATETATAKISTAKTAIAQTAIAKTSIGQTLPAEARLRWTLSPDGSVQRSLNSGKTWQIIPVAGNIVFRALAANDSDIWVGGSAGALFHSADAGQHWDQIKPSVDGKPLAADIIGLKFSDALHGSLTTSSNQIWTTSDGGSSWHIE
jgi:hypothetical protein